MLGRAARQLVQRTGRSRRHSSEARAIGGGTRSVAIAGAAVLYLLLAGQPLEAHDPGPSGPPHRFQDHLDQFRANPGNAPILFPKWESAINRFYSDPYMGGYQVFVAQWDAFLATIYDAAPAEQLRRVNDYVNRIGYLRDSPRREGGDYWKSPAEFFASGGDCEDYAVAKYWSLRKLGFAAADLRILVLYAVDDRAAHAALRVRIGPRFYLLDNLTRPVLPLERVRNYVAIYGLNETHAWLFADGRRLDRDTPFRAATPYDGSAPPSGR